MINIDIDAPRPLQLLFIFGAAVMAGAYFAPAYGDSSASGGGREHTAQAIVRAEDDVKSLRDRQELLNHREEILRSQLEYLQGELEDDAADPALEAAVAAAADRLRGLLADQRETEAQLLASLQQIWDAQGKGIAASVRRRASAKAQLAQWPVAPHRGISAYYHDPSYRQHFGVEHDAIDIPVPQGTLLRAAADSTVITTTDNGYGFSSIVLQSEEGITYLYGHVSSLLVEEGDSVRAGDIVAKSGGMPGSKGAGLMTTGPHLHMEVMVDGEHRDPLEFLPPIATGEGNTVERKFYR